MTQQKSFKRAVRERMAKTGERYTAARAQLVPVEEPPAPAYAYEPQMSSDAVRRGTGRDWDEWFALLDEWGGTDHEHKEIAAWLNTEHGVPGWWAQGVTVEYERARGLRSLGSGRDGLFSVGATRTIAVPVEQLYAAVVDPELRERWLPGDRVHERTVLPHRSARYDWEGGPTRVVVGFAEKGPGKSQIAVSHERVPDAEVAEVLKAYWRARLTALNALLEADRG